MMPAVSPSKLHISDIRVNQWFEARGWEIFPFQRDVWEAHGAGESGLVHCSTGAGKTYAVWFAALREAMTDPDARGLQVLWVTPLRALAADTEAALAAPVRDLDLSWRIGVRNGDSTATQRRKLLENPPETLVTTPESLALLLSQPAFIPHFARLKMIVLDEWHELLGTKRGVMVELAMARLRTLAPRARRWGLSATLGNIAEAAQVLGGFNADGTPVPMRVIRGPIKKTVCIETLLPPADTHYPWAGHLGLHLLPGVVDVLRQNPTSIVFTNTRSQAEIWFHALEVACPDWVGKIGLHHGSLSRDVREASESGLASGSLRAVIATSSLDLGVDFSPVDCVLQVGSPKGVARLMQRAGRSGHRPGATSRIICVPANSFELLEFAAARDAAMAGVVEARPPLVNALDVLCQHLISIAAGGRYFAEEIRREVLTTHAYRSISAAEWAWVLDFASRGGESLRAYPQYARMSIDAEGVVSIADEGVARQHRMNIGTIVSEASVNIRFQNGMSLGNVEESFLAKLRNGDRFLFAGRCLALVRVRDLRATVRVARGRPNGVPRWMGGKMPLSSSLSSAVRERLTQAARGDLPDVPELQRLAPILAIQAKQSAIPSQDQLLIEKLQSRDGSHLFIYPFEGRLVHEGLAALFAYRLAQVQPITFSLAVNDYGMELLSADPAPFDEALPEHLFRVEGLVEDILGSMHSVEMARRRFREIARIAGLVQEGVGRNKKSARALTISSSLLFDVFTKYEPQNMLLEQATREVLESQLEQTRLRATLESLGTKQLLVRQIQSVTPLSYPLFAERLRQQLSSEDLSVRIARMEASMEHGDRAASVLRARRVG